MISSRLQLFIIVFLIALVGFSIAAYKAIFLDIPLTPHKKRSLYTITASVNVEKSDKPVVVSMALPQSQNGLEIFSSDVDSGAFGYTVAHQGDLQRAVWAKRSLQKSAKLFYKVNVLVDKFDAMQSNEEEHYDLEESKLYLWDDTQISAAKSLIAYVHEHSADNSTFVAQLIALFNEKNPREFVRTLLENKFESKISLILELLRYEKIAFKKIRGIELVDRQKNRKLITMLKVKNGSSSDLYSFKDGKVAKPNNFFIWYEGNDALLITKGTKRSKLRFSVSEMKVSATKIAKDQIRDTNAEFINFSLYTLPSSQQNAFKQLLLIPIGALIVVIMRIFVGIRTMGTFMPILFSLAFMQTTLVSGILMFLLIISIGLFVRAYLTRLQLLLVARISAVIIVVVAIMSIMSIVSYKLGVNELLQVTFFPMIILSWTIERMSILWEEEGQHEALVQGGGSLLVAVIAYFAMDNMIVRYFTFNFPELILIVLALIILIGRYTGYRLSELFRFASLGK